MLHDKDEPAEASKQDSRGLLQFIMMSQTKTRWSGLYNENKTSGSCSQTHESCSFPFCNYYYKQNNPPILYTFEREREEKVRCTSSKKHFLITWKLFNLKGQYIFLHTGI